MALKLVQRRHPSFLVSTGLLMNITKEQTEEGGHKKESNKYFLRGCREFFVGSKVVSDKVPATA